MDTNCPIFPPSIIAQAGTLYNVHPEDCFSPWLCQSGWKCFITLGPLSGPAQPPSFPATKLYLRFSCWFISDANKRVVLMPPRPHDQGVPMCGGQATGASSQLALILTLPIIVRSCSIPSESGGQEVLRCLDHIGCTFCIQGMIT